MTGIALKGQPKRVCATRTFSKNTPSPAASPVPFCGIAARFGSASTPKVDISDRGGRHDIDRGAAGEIADGHKASGGTYGVRRVTASSRSVATSSSGTARWTQQYTFLAGRVLGDVREPQLIGPVAREHPSDQVKRGDLRKPGALRQPAVIPRALRTSTLV